MNAPGSRAAIKQGCTCPEEINHHGTGGVKITRVSNETDLVLVQWAIHTKCPLHGTTGPGQWICK